MDQIYRGRAASTAIGLFLAAAPAAAYAQISYDLQLPAQDMADSLRAVGSRTHVNVAFDPALVRGKIAPALRGTYSPQEALQRLTADAGLGVRASGARSYVVVMAPIRTAFSVQDTQSPEPRGAPGGAAPTPSADGARTRDGVQLQEVIVTGSRAAVQGFSAPTPTQVIGSDLIDRQGAATVAQVLFENPAFKATRSAGSTAGTTGAPGQATADLRGLGGQRTLVLFNGSRIVPQAPANNLGIPVATDLNLIPTMMIDRVEVVTGGASAQYGSDAVAGVVNILLKKRMDGVRLTAQAGVSQEGDNESIRVGGMGGFSYAGDRGHFIGSIEYSNSKGGGDYTNRDWAREGWQVVSNANFRTNGQPAFVMAPNVVNSLGSGGVISGPANFSLAGQTFNADGTLRPFQYGSVRNATLQVGGEGTPFAVADILPSVERFTTYGRTEYELTDDALVFLELGYSRSKGAFYNNTPSFAALTIRSDNPYLPAAVRTALAQQNLTSFNFTRFAPELGRNHYDVYNETPRGSVGIEGSLGGSWRYDAHYSYGLNDYKLISTNNALTPNSNFAIDAAVNPANGQIVCRATLPGAAFNPAAAGCAPMNLFGSGNISQAAHDYVTASGRATARYTQHAAAANIRGEPFSTWAGPISMAAGVEYRRESEEVTADANAAANAFTASGNAAPFTGHFDVKEGYVEAIVPLARDMAFAHALDLNGAVRYADYSTVGAQTTWKVGAVYEPIEGLRLRGTRSRDIRAPAIFELFSPGSEVTNQVNVRGQAPRIPQNANAGNPDLDPEVANTWTIGAVFEPTGSLLGLRASVDYFDIEITGAITNLSAGNIGSLCTLGDAQFCSYFTFNANGVPTRLRAPTLNLGAFHNQGVDTAVTYTRPLDRLGDGGTISANFSGTYARHAYVSTGAPGSAAIDRAGENGQQNLGAVPRFRGNLSTTLRNNRWSLTTQFVYISRGKLDNTYNTVPELTINQNSIRAMTYVNLYGTVNIKDVEFFATVNNVLNSDPPPSPYPIINAPVNGQYYDKVGRTFQIGANLRF